MTDRPMQPYRDDYEQTGVQDYFIVKLLGNAIRERLGALCTGAVGLKVLDVGCGRQPFRKLFELRGCRYHAQDVVQNLDSSVQYVCPIDGELSGALVDSRPFDLILCTEVLEHVADWPTAFRNFGLLLKPGGKMLLTIPHYYKLHEEPWDFWRPTLHGIRYYAEKSGFTVVEATAAGTPWDVLGTFLGNLWVTPANPGIVSRAVTKCIEIGLGLLRRCLQSGSVQRFSVATAKTYLSNVVVLMRNPQVG